MASDADPGAPGLASVAALRGLRHPAVVDTCEQALAVDEVVQGVEGGASWPVDGPPPGGVSRARSAVVAGGRSAFGPHSSTKFALPSSCGMRQPRATWAPCRASSTARLRVRRWSPVGTTNCRAERHAGRPSDRRPQGRPRGRAPPCRGSPAAARPGAARRRRAPARAAGPGRAPPRRCPRRGRAPRTMRRSRRRRSRGRRAAHRPDRRTPPPAATAGRSASANRPSTRR